MFIPDFLIILEGFMEIKYDNHDIGWDLAVNVDGFKQTAESWQRRDTVYGWLEDRKMGLISPFIDNFPECSWLTVGDGRYGMDAKWILSRGIRYVHASDMDDTLLHIGHQKGYIKKYSAENAESLSFSDESFDFILCKDALHHCPRPFHALWEMLRCARSCVILLEPVDHNANHEFENIGNYIYKLSIRDYEKFLLGIHYRWIAFKGYNDIFFEGLENCPLSGGSDEDAINRQKVFDFISQSDQEGVNGKPYPWSAVALFKAPPSDLMISVLHASGWNVVELPKNPYIRRFAK